jgi:phosphohistidine phosphatase
MELLVVRHAIAEDREVFARTGKGDDARPLTARGRRRFEKGARGLARLVPSVHLLATSALLRATQTGEVLADACGHPRTVRLPELAPDAEPEALVAWLRAQRGATVAIVGHEPHLSSVVELLLSGRSSGFLELRKGGACLLSLPRPPAAGGARLRWLLTAGQLRRLAA